MVLLVLLNEPQLELSDEREPGREGELRQGGLALSPLLRRILCHIGQGVADKLMPGGPTILDEAGVRPNGVVAGVSAGGGGAIGLFGCSLV